MRENQINDWDELWMRHVYLISSKSKDRSTQIGAVLVRDGVLISEGYNGICRGVNDGIEERNVRPEKYFWFEHGERNAIYNAARNGIKTLGSTMFTQYPPCTDCGRAVIQAGIKEIVCHRQFCELWDKIKSEKWVGQDNKTFEMFIEAKIQIRYFDKPLGVKSWLSEKVYEV
jgi:dCMP deaminase